MTIRKGSASRLGFTGGQLGYARFGDTAAASFGRKQDSNLARPTRRSVRAVLVDAEKVRARSRRTEQ